MGREAAKKMGKRRGLEASLEGENLSAFVSLLSSIVVKHGEACCGFETGGSVEHCRSILGKTENALEVGKR